MRDTELRGFTVYGQPISSPVLTWLPLFAGFVAAAGVASITCPVPCPQTLSGSGALLLSAKYVVSTIVVSAVAFAGVHAATSPKPSISFRIMLLQFCGVAAWFAPMLVFLARRSIWAVSIAVVLAGKATTLIHGYRKALEAFEKTSVSDPGAIIHPMEPSSSNLFAMVSASLCVQLALICVIGGWLRSASAAIGVGIALITWFGKSTITSDKYQPRNLPSRALRSLSTVGLAAAFTAAGLTPYMAIESGTDGPSQGAYSVLHAFFGEEDTASAADPRKPPDKNIRSMVIGDSYSGMILRPETEEYVTIVPPLPRRRMFDINRNTQKTEPLTIPFFGAYWFFRAPEGGLPADSVESRGDPASISFRTTDWTPMSMEARQNFGSPIDLSCCKEIQVIINNGDRRPKTVSLELILVDTTLRGQPRQSLGKAPVNSSLPWRRLADDRPPVAEVLSFAVPAHATIERFDQVIIRFELRPPRQVWSAKMAIDRLRLIPRGL